MMKIIEVEWLGKKIKVPAEKIQGKTWYHINGETYCYEPASGSKSRGAQDENAAPGVCLSPMPGKIIKLAVKVGQNVRQGDLLIAMEAMKMEYSLESDIDGEVVEVNCDEGDQVKLKQTLVVVKGETANVT